MTVYDDYHPLTHMHRWDKNVPPHMEVGQLRYLVFWEHHLGHTVMYHVPPLVLIRVVFCLRQERDSWWR
jgi:hypothetical protein